ncbi:putative signal peptide protein [Puccinia sorghi]|uniref:Putative signal peptide protein n=1 Tax=Puccinia sorghi TaxID=27349 RepID=A0A0L6VEM9_9BASI|nr:putative signal peptide protein [Puccinia sorghi]
MMIQRGLGLSQMCQHPLPVVMSAWLLPTCANPWTTKLWMAGNVLACKICPQDSNGPTFTKWFMGTWLFSVLIIRGGKSRNICGFFLLRQSGNFGEVQQLVYLGSSCTSRLVEYSGADRGSVEDSGRLYPVARTLSKAALSCCWTIHGIVDNNNQREDQGLEISSMGTQKHSWDALALQGISQYVRGSGNSVFHCVKLSKEYITHRCFQIINYIFLMHTIGVNLLLRQDLEKPNKTFQQNDCVEYQGIVNVIFLQYLAVLFVISLTMVHCEMNCYGALCNLGITEQWEAEFTRGTRFIFSHSKSASAGAEDATRSPPLASPRNCMGARLSTVQLTKNVISEGILHMHIPIHVCSGFLSPMFWGAANILQYPQETQSVFQSYTATPATNSSVDPTSSISLDSKSYMRPMGLRLTKRKEAKLMVSEKKSKSLRKTQTKGPNKAFQTVLTKKCNILKKRSKHEEEEKQLEHQVRSYAQSLHFSLQYSLFLCCFYYSSSHATPSCAFYKCSDSNGDKKFEFLVEKRISRKMLQKQNLNQELQLWLLSSLVLVLSLSLLLLVLLVLSESCVLEP